jgi:uncharacterized glyoxalase superfamily protein PhnB
MKTLNPYINFGGKCREAMAFYRDVFGGQITALEPPDAALPDAVATGAEPLWIVGAVAGG